MRREKIKSLDKFFLISNQPLFEPLTDEEKSFIANRCQVAEYNRGDLIYKESGKKDFFHIITSGRILLFHPPKKSSEKKEIAVEVLRKGDYFGIVSLLTGEPHSVSARVVNDARLLKIDEKSFNEILEKIPHLAVRISQSLSRRFRIKRGAAKEVFQTIIVSAYCKGDESYTSYYSANLAKAIKKEAGKKTIILSINKNTAKPLLPAGIKQEPIEVDDPKKISDVLSNFIGQYHFIICDLPKQYNDITKKFIKQSDLYHFLCEDTKDAPVYATIPEEKEIVDKVLKRIAREITGVRVGLALGSGGAIGLAQIGILEALEKENIPIDIIAGTSIGALIGALWAAGYKAAEIEKIFSEVNTRSKALQLIDLIFPRRGLLAGLRVRKLLAKYLGNKTFRNIKMPLKIVACDIRTRREIVIEKGKLIDAVMASIAIPGLFKPFVTNRGVSLVDGGIVNPVPISVLSKNGIKRIIAVNSIPSPEDVRKNINKKNETILGIIVNSFYSMQYKIARYACQEADVYIHPILKGAQWFEFYKAKEFIKLGRQQVRENIYKIRELLKK